MHDYDTQVSFARHTLRSFRCWSFRRTMANDWQYRMHRMFSIITKHWTTIGPFLLAIHSQLMDASQGYHEAVPAEPLVGMRKARNHSTTGGVLAVVCAVIMCHRQFTVISGSNLDGLVSRAALVCVVFFWFDRCRLEVVMRDLVQAIFPQVHRCFGVRMCGLQ